VKLLRTNYSGLKKNETTTAYSSLVVLGSIGSSAEASIPLLTRILSDKKLDSSTHALAAFALGNIGPNAKSAVPALIDAIRDKQFERVGGSSLTLIINGLSLGDKTVGLRGEAALALGKIGDKRSVPDLIKALDDDGHFPRGLDAGTVLITGVSYSVRTEAAHALSLLDSRIAHPALSVLQTAFDEELKKDESDRMVTTELFLACAIARHVPERRDEAVKVIARQLKSDEIALRALAAELLGRIGPQARVAVPQLKVATLDYHLYVRKQARIALKKIQK